MNQRLWCGSVPSRGRESAPLTAADLCRSAIDAMINLYTGAGDPADSVRFGRSIDKNMGHTPGSFMKGLTL